MTFDLSTGTVHGRSLLYKHHVYVVYICCVHVVKKMSYTDESHYLEVHGTDDKSGCKLLLSVIYNILIMICTYF